MDEQTRQNEILWDELAKNGVLCSQPKIGLTPELAKAYINRRGFYQDDLQDKEVLCLAAGGGQQSIGFALLGAKVTVVDFSEEQLKKDRFVAKSYQKVIRTIKGDMRDLSFFEDEVFDIVYQPYSINYIPEVASVFREVSRVLKPGGLYDLMFHNPFVHGSWRNACWEGEWKQDELWEGKGYPIWQPYKHGSRIKTVDPNWRFENLENQRVKIPAPQEYRLTMSSIINGLICRDLEILAFQEEAGTMYESEPGTWEHYTSCAPPWMYVLSKKKN